MVHNKIYKIGVFDSGIGGLHVLRELFNRSLNTELYYLSDTEHVPYGNLSRSQILQYVINCFRLFEQIGVDAVVIACNTATAMCIQELRTQFDFCIVGMQPAVKQALKYHASTMVLATPATIDSVSFHHLIDQYEPSRVSTFACPRLAKNIEENVNCLDKIDILSHLPLTHAESIVLGCTHYIYLKQAIRSIYQCPVYDGIVGTVDHLCKKVGIFDHFDSNRAKVHFLGKNWQKNASIFDFLVDLQ